MHMKRSECGQSVALIALFMVFFLFGFMALALDIGYMFQQRRMAQSAADAAAVAAAEEYSNGSAAEQTAANSLATLNGFNTSASTNPAVVTFPTSTTCNNGGTSGGSCVQAVVTQPIPTFFLNAFGSGRSLLSVAASATASTGQNSPTCICLEGTSGTDLNMSNNAQIKAGTCGLVDDSSATPAVTATGSAQICPMSLGTVASSSSWDNSSYVNNGAGICATTTVVGGVGACSPALPTAPSFTTGDCSADPFNSIQGGGVSYTVGPGSTYGTTQGGNQVCYNALTVNGNGDTVTLKPGIYIINGGELHFESGTQLGGNGVLFYLTGGASVVIDNGANVNLVAGGNTENGGATAPSVASNYGSSSGTSYNGIVFYQASTDTSTLSIQGGSSTYINGNMYAPGGSINLGNGSGSNVTGGIVAQTLTMEGGAILNATSSDDEGTANTSVAKLVQ